MLTPEPDGSTTGEVADDRAQEEKYAYEAWMRANRAHQRMVVDRHLSVRHEDRATEAMGEAMYTHTLRIRRWEGNDSIGSKINSRKQVETDLGKSLGGQGESGMPYPSYCGG